MRSSGHRRINAVVFARFFRLVVGVLLLAAAFLKTLEFWTGAHRVAIDWTTGSTVILVQYEIALGLSLAFGLASAFVDKICIATFSCFAVFSIGSGILGNESCGCFGAIEIPPFVTALVDVVIVAVLLLLCDIQPIASRGVSRTNILLVVLMGVGFSAINLAGFFRLAGAPALDNSTVHSKASIVRLEPRKWIGHPCPLLPYVRSLTNLDVGNWFLVLYRPGCADCEKVLSRMEDFTAGGNVAAVSTSPSLTRPKQEHSDLKYGSLSTGVTWIVDTPIVIVLRDGRVKAVLPIDHVIIGGA